MSFRLRMRDLFWSILAVGWFVDHKHLTENGKLVFANSLMQVQVPYSTPVPAAPFVEQQADTPIDNMPILRPLKHLTAPPPAPVDHFSVKPMPPG